MNELVRHRPGASAVVRFTNGERIRLSIAPSGIAIAKLWLGRVRGRTFLHWSRHEPKRLDRALVFFLSGPDPDLPGNTVLELMVARFLRECHSIDDVIRLCEPIR